MHELTHPSAKRGRQQEAPATSDDEADAETLLASLVAEAEEEPENIEETEDDPLC